MTQWGLDVLFNPAKRHMDEAKLREQSTREEAGDSSGGRRIDLESGRVVIRRKSTETDDATETDETDDATETDDSEDESAGDEPADQAVAENQTAGDAVDDDTH